MFAIIQPVSTGVPAKTADKLRVANVQINTVGPDGSADVRWQLYNDAGSVLEGSSVLAGAAYAAWGSDDEYLLTWLATPEVLNLTIVEIVPDAPPAPEPPVVEPPAPVITAPPVRPDGAPLPPTDGGV